MGDGGRIPIGSLARSQLPFRCWACNLLLELLDLEDILGVWKPLLTAWQISLILGRHVSADPVTWWGRDITTPDLSFFKWHLGRKLASLQDPEPLLSSWLHVCAPSRVSLSLRYSVAGWTGDSRALTLPILDWCPTWRQVGVLCTRFFFSFPNFQIFSAWENSGKSLENWFCFEHQLVWLPRTLFLKRLLSLELGSGLPFWWHVDSLFAAVPTTPNGLAFCLWNLRSLSDTQKHLTLQTFVQTYFLPKSLMKIFFSWFMGTCSFSFLLYTPSPTSFLSPNLSSVDISICRAL